MSSTNSTANLHLNQWAGFDKPKMEDFNQDNRKIDAAIAGHAANTLLHVAEAERALWNSAAPVVGTYLGDARTERLIELGFQPSFGIVFAIDKNLVQSSGSTGNMLVFSAFVSKHGCSQCAFIEPAGFTVLNLAQVVSNRIAMLNESGVAYVYAMFR